MRRHLRRARAPLPRIRSLRPSPRLGRDLGPRPGRLSGRGVGLGGLRPLRHARLDAPEPRRRRRLAPSGPAGTRTGRSGRRDGTGPARLCRHGRPRPDPPQPRHPERPRHRSRPLDAPAPHPAGHGQEAARKAGAETGTRAQPPHGRPRSPGRRDPGHGPVVGRQVRPFRRFRRYFCADPRDYPTPRTAAGSAGGCRPWCRHWRRGAGRRRCARGPG